jgi:serine/threonine-protein kinase
VLVRETQLSVERAADVLIQVGEALMEAHAIGYVHRDLRPRNIYLSVRRGKANFIKLLDFGLAKLVETEGQAASTSLGMTFGDPRYMSPEQARGDRIDRRADIYQLGCVAYEMLTGAPPFAGNRVFDILTKQVTEAPQPLPTRRPGVPLWMEAAVTKMLAKDPDNRFATTTRMVEALRRGLENGEVMEAEVARRRESIPPPSVSRVMQKMGITTPADPPMSTMPLPADGVIAPPPARVPPAAVRSTSAPMPAAAPAPMVPAVPAVSRSLAAFDPGVTMKGSVPAPLKPDAKPDSVELLRKRTGTPRVGVPIHAAMPPIQAPVAGVIDPPLAPPLAPPIAPPPAPPIVTTASVIPAAASQPLPAHGRESQSTRLARSAVEPPAPRAPVMPPSATEDGHARGKRPSAPDDLNNISQVWYDEGDQLSVDDEPTTARRQRARKTISPSATDVGFYDERPRRRWGLLLGLGVFAVVGGAAAFALSHRSAPEIPPPPMTVVQPSATAPIDAAPSTIIAADPSAPSSTSPSAPVTPPPTAAKPVAATHRPAETRVAAAESPAPVGARRTSPATGFPILGSEPTRRGPGAALVPPSNPSTQPAVIAAPQNSAASATPVSPSLTDGPKDPYGGSSDAAGDGSSPDKKAEFFANLGGQQLIAGDTAGAAANFKKAIELDGKNLAAILGMGEIALRQGLFGDAIAHLTKAVKLAPKNSKSLTLLGEAYLNSGNNAQAAAQFKKALQIDPDNARARDGYNEASSRVPPPDDDPQ